MGEAENRKEHRSFLCGDIYMSEKYAASASNGGKAHLFGRREKWFENKVELR